MRDSVIPLINRQKDFMERKLEEAELAGELTCQEMWGVRLRVRHLGRAFIEIHKGRALQRWLRGD